MIITVRGLFFPQCLCLTYMKYTYTTIHLDKVLKDIIAAVNFPLLRNCITWRRCFIKL